jgi:hypothetical protein
MKTAKRERNPKVTTKRIVSQTKAEMIATIQRREAALWLTLKETEECWGPDDDSTVIARARWSAIHDMMKALGIPQDFMLPDNQAATAIIIRRIRA